MKRDVLVILVAAMAILLAGCATIPVLEPDGSPKLDDSGKPIVERALDYEKIGGAVGASAPFLPPPFGALLPLAVTAFTIIRREQA